ncbi:Transposon Tf2-9 poly, partial [Paramuricea clavata]
MIETIETGNCSEAKQFLIPYYEVRDELFVADGVIMRMDRIVSPSQQKMAELPDRPWDVVEADFCEICTEVDMVTSTSTIPVTKKLKKIFSTHGIPRILQTVNGPPFNGEQFQAFAEEMGFHHKRVTPIHLKAQGQVENFNKRINKTTKIACEEGIDIKSAIYDMLQAYRQTPHPATKSKPYAVLMHRQVRARLEHFPTEVHITQDE